MTAVATPLPARPPGVEPFTHTRRVRIGEAGADRQLRLDGISSYLQDVGFDHLDVMPDGHAHPAWIVRRAVIDVLRPIPFGERVTVRVGRQRRRRGGAACGCRSRATTADSWRPRASSSTSTPSAVFRRG